MAFKCNSVDAAAVLALLVVAWTAPAKASTLTVFARGPGCSGKTKDIQGGSCFDLTGYQSGYHFVFTEDQEAILYTDRSKYNPVVLNWETRNCRRFPYKSVELVC